MTATHWKTTTRILGIMVTSACLSADAAEPTAQRLWTASNGKTVNGVVTAIEGGNAVLKRAEGPVVKVPLSVFVPDDQAILREHFELDEMAPVDAPRGSDAEGATDLPHPLGEVTGPIKANATSHYFVYLPKSLKKNREAPLMFFSSASGGKESSLNVIMEAAERGGWILGVSVESSNKLGYPASTAACVASVTHMLETLPIDEKRIYYMGGSGGGAQAMSNSSTIRATGVMPWVTYAAAPGQPDSSCYYIIGGAKDLNRYCTADSMNELKGKSVLRFHPGGHTGPKWMLEDGMFWMNGMFLAENKDAYTDVVLDYEAAALDWLKNLAESEPSRTYANLDFLINDYKISGQNQQAAQSLYAELRKDAKNVRHVEGLKAIEDFGKRKLSGCAVKGNTPRGHSDSRIEREANKLAEEYQGVPLIEDVFRALASPTI